MRIISIIVFLLAIAASPAIASINIFACEPEWKSLAETIGGKKIKVYSATTAFQDPHHIEARPSLIAKARRADMIFCTGAELEIGWLPLLLRQSGNAKIQENQPGYFLAASHVKRIEIPEAVNRRDGDVHASGNPHVHWDPYRLLTIADKFTQRLQVIDSHNAEYYEQRYQRFAEKWQASISKWEQLKPELQGKKTIVYHKNWSYLLNWLGIKEIGDLEPKPGIPPNSAHLARLLVEAKTHQPDFILIANYQNDKGASWLGNKTATPVLHLPFTVGGNANTNDLFTLYDEVLTLLHTIK